MNHTQATYPLVIIALCAALIVGCAKASTETAPAAKAPSNAETSAKVTPAPAPEAKPAPTAAPTDKPAAAAAPEDKPAPSAAPEAKDQPASEQGIALTKPMTGEPLTKPKNPGVTEASCKTVCSRMRELAFSAIPPDADPGLKAQMNEAFGAPCLKGCFEEATAESNACIMAAKDVKALEACAP